MPVSDCILFRSGLTFIMFLYAGHALKVWAMLTTAQFTEDAVFVELLPRLTVMHGKAEIEKHYQQLFDAGAANFDQKITEAEPNGSLGFRPYSTTMRSDSKPPKGA